MDLETYRKKYFVKPTPIQRFKFGGLQGLTLYFSDYYDAILYYESVFGPPAYIEGEFTRGWQIGNTWLTLLKGKDGNPQNVEVMIYMQTLQEVASLKDAFVNAGGIGSDPADQLMYERVHSCSVIDPFGTNILITCLV